MPSAFEQLCARVHALHAMPTVPAIIQPLAAALHQPADRVDMEKIVDLVSRDSSIAAQCLRIANSPLFGRRNTETVRSAVLALGLKRTEAVLLGCSLNQVVAPEKWVFEAITYWRHSMGCALVCSWLAKLIGYPDPEKVYLGGLLHDVGILVNCMGCTEEFKRCIQTAREARRPLHEIEQQQLGFTHCQSGAVLAKQWNFPPDLIEVIEFHHDITKAPPERPLIWIVHLGDLLCRVRQLGYGYYEAVAVDLAGSEAWTRMVRHFPNLARLDLARLTLDIDGAIEEITQVVDAVFSRPFMH